MQRIINKNRFILAVLILVLGFNITYALSVRGEFYGAKLGTVVDAIAKLSNKNIIWDSKAISKKDTPVYLSISQSTPINTLFKFVLKENGLTYVVRGNLYVIKPASEFVVTVPPNILRYVGKEVYFNILDIIRKNVSSTAEIKIYTETNSIYVKDTAENIKKIKDIVNEYKKYLEDEAKKNEEKHKKEESIESMLATKEVIMTPEEFKEIEDELLITLSPNGKYEYDPETGRLKVVDLRQNIVKISKLIAKAQKVEIRTKCYYVKGIEPGELLMVIKQNFLSKYGTIFYKSKETSEVIQKGGKEEQEKTGVKKSSSGEIITSLPKICITDKPEVIDRVRKSFADILLNRPYQIAIEARIVQISSSFKRELGINWGIGTARGGDISIKLGHSDIARARLGSNYNVKLQSGVNFNGGSLALNFDTGTSVPVGTAGLLAVGLAGAKTNIDLTLGALESVGKSKTLSRPKIITIDGETAVISQGIEIPYTTVSATSGATMQTVQFKKAELKLEVTPRTTPDGNIIMDIKLKQDSPDFGNAVAGQPPINTKTVESKVVAKDGATIVIGGVLERREGTGESGVPLLKEIPLLGWLFRYNYRQIDNTELLIFITPKIVYE